MSARTSSRISRRWFIGGLASFGAFGGCRFLPGGLFGSGRPNLTLGVVSDVHIQKLGKGEGPRAPGRNAETLRLTLEWFRDQGVDGVILAGDMADNGTIEQLQAVASVWNDVFPDNRAPDGRRVEKLFVYGNHDMAGLAWARGCFPGKKDDEIASHVIYTDPKSAWETAFNEPYEPIWLKRVNGYSFVGAHWLSPVGGSSAKPSPGLSEFYAKHAKELDPKLPFFHVQHPHLKDTCYGPWAWGHDDGESTATLSAFPNAIAFSGHSHYSLTDEKSIWQGAFTSVGTSSLSYIDLGYEEFPNVGFENSRTIGDGEAWRVNSRKMMGYFQYDKGFEGRQGMLWRVYDDRIVVRRREFLAGLDLGADWVLPLPAAESKPYAFAEHAKHLGVPEFAPGAALAVARVRAKNRGGTIYCVGVPLDELRKEKDALTVTIPPVVADPAARVYCFAIEAKEASGKTMTKRMPAEGFHLGVTAPEAAKPTVCTFACEELPKGATELAVYPVNSFGARGKPLTIAIPLKKEEKKKC